MNVKDPATLPEQVEKAVVLRALAILIKQGVEDSKRPDIHGAVTQAINEYLLAIKPAGST